MTIEDCKNIISDFCIKEYGSKADFTDMEKVNIAFTTTDGKAEKEIQVSANLVKRYIDTDINGTFKHRKIFASYDDFYIFLSSMTFDELVVMYI